MTALPPDTPALAWIPNPEDFNSPFPTTFDSAALTALGGNSPALLAGAGATAWAKGTQVALKAKAGFVGDIRSDWLSQIISQDPDTQAWKGLFAQIQFPTDSDSPLAFEQKLVNSGFDVATTLVSAVPVYGQIIAGVLDVAQYFYNLFRKEDPEERLPLVPMEKYSQGIDEDFLKVAVFRRMKTVDWTGIFWPHLRWQTGWRMLPGDDEKRTWAWGTFGAGGGEPERTTDVPGDPYGGGLGFMPGTQKLNAVTQMTRFGQYQGPTGRLDTIVPVGSFFPATANVCTSLWEMVRKPGNPDMFKVRAGETWSAWNSYFAAMRQSFLDEWNSLWNKGKTWDEPGSVVDLGKLMSPMVSRNINLEGINNRWMWPLMFQKDGSWQPDPNDGRPGCDRDDYAYQNDPSSGWLSDPEYQAGAVWPPDRCAGSYNQTIRKSVYKDLSALVLPACEGLKQNQFTTLYTTEVCAYVRPLDVDPSLPRYAAFEDESVPWGGGAGTFGEQLTERCLHAREVLLTRDLRFKVRLDTVDSIDPGYAARLRQSGVTETSWKRPVMEIAAGPVGVGESEPPEPSPGPGGGTPFGLVEASAIRPGGGGLLLGAAAVAAFAALRGR
jgi:hypothetical protein